MPAMIVQLEPNDSAAWLARWPAITPAHAEAIIAELIAGSRRIFECWVNGLAVGQVSLVTAKDDPDYVIPGQRAYLSRLYVLPGYRRQGIATALVQHLCACAKGLGYAEVSVGVDHANLAARQLYARMGFDTVIYDGEDADGRYLKLLKMLDPQPPSAG